MKILIWSQYFWPESFHINEIATGLAEHGHHVTVLTGKPNYPHGKVFAGYKLGGHQREQFGDVVIERIPILPRRHGGFFLALNYLSFIVSGYANASRALRDRQFDVLLVFAPSPLLQALPAIRFARRSHVPLVLWVQDLWPEVLEATGYVSNKTLLWLLKKLVRRIYARSDVILAQSEAFRERLAGHVDDPKKIHFFPNTVDERTLDQVGSSRANELAKMMQSSFSVTFTGNLGQAQSLETILEAAEALGSVEDVKFFVVGTGSRIDWLTDEVRRRRLGNVVLAGPYSKEDMPTIMRASSTLLLTLGSGVVGSYTVPSKLQAYMAMGRPIVASANGEAARVLVDSRSGMVCKAGDGCGLAKAIMQIHDMSASEREDMGRNGLRYFVQHYSLQRWIKSLLAILEESRREFGSNVR